MSELFASLRTIPRPIRIAALATLVNRIGTMALPFLVLYLAEERALPADDAGEVLLAYGAGSLLAAPLAAHELPRRGPRTVMIAALVLSAAAMAALPSLGHRWALDADAFVWGLGGETFRPACGVVVSQHLPAERRREGFALLRMTGNLGMAIGPLVGGVLASRSYAALFVVDALTSILAAITLALPAARSLSVTAAEASSRRVRAEPRGAVAIHLTAVVAVALVAYQYGSSGALYMTRDLRLSQGAYGTAFAASGWLIVVAELPLSRALRDASHRRLLAIGTLLVAAGFASFAIVDDFRGVLVATSVLTIGEMMLGPAAAARVADLEPLDRPGAYLGYYNAAWSGASAIGPWLGLRSLELLGAERHWLLFGALGVIAMVLFAATPGQRAVHS